jgi:serine/threonine protein kinase/tetratricopeptide (TPR) repeat protein
VDNEKKQRYRVLTKLGAGGMGEVFLAEDTLLGRKVVLKFLTKASRQDPIARRRLLREAKAAAAIDHPYVCKIYEAGEENGNLFIAMEYVEGQDLFQRLRKGRLPIEEAVRIGLEIIEGLARAHEGGVVHRDLKPSNVMLTPDGHVKIVDFGLARRIITDDSPTLSGPSLTADGAMVGTMVYMSPEQIQGEQADERSDVFAFGLVFFEMLAGRHPFPGKTYIETATSILREEAPPLSRFVADCPPALEEIVSRMLSKRPQDRPASAIEVAHALRGYRSGAHSGFAPRPRSGIGRAASIAVLPFANRSRDEEFEYFVEGMTDEINARISKIPGLKVIARTSAMRYKGSQKSMQEIGGELDVGFLLEGSVQQAANRVRIIAGLVETADGSQVWAETYDRDMKDVFGIQTDVSRNIAVAIRGRFSGVSATGFSASGERPRSMTAYHLFLRGNYYMNKWKPDAVKRAIEFFEQAIEHEPTYSPSYAGLATCYGKAAMMGFLPATEIATLAPKARDAARRALQLNPNLPEAHVGSAVVALGLDWDFAAAEKAFDRALELNPNFADAHTLLSWLLTALCRFDDARPHAERAVELSPLDPAALTHLAWLILHSRGPEDAVEQRLHQALEIDPSFPTAKVTMGIYLLNRGETAKGLRLIEECTWARAQLGSMFALAGNLERAREILEEVTRPEVAGRHSPFDVGRLCLALGEVDRGFEFLDRAFRLRDSLLFMLAVAFSTSPLLQPYRSDPRYLDLRRRIGLP